MRKGLSRRIDNFLDNYKPGNIRDNIRHRIRAAKWRMCHPFPIEAPWSADYWIARQVEPVIRYMSKGQVGHPAELEYEEWLAILTRIADGFAATIEIWDGGHDREREEELRKIQKKGLKLFAKWYTSLWD